MIEGVLILHENNIAWRDIKLSNFVINKNVIKLIDFGVSSYFINGKDYDEHYIVGTP